jgi:pimeloyl-ACP methyl ester carboxylesterase
MKTLIGSRTAGGLWSAHGGAGADLMVLLHGIGGNATVWEPFIAHLEAQGRHRWLAPDLRGHGRSTMDGPFEFAQHAADIAGLLRGEEPARVVVLGHSFGGVIAAHLGSGRYGFTPSRIVTHSVKLEWTHAEIAKFHEIAGKPARTLATRAEAVDRYLKGAGLFGLQSPESPLVEAGIVEDGAGYRVALAPRVFSAIGADLPAAFAAVRVPLRMGAGSKDPMVGLAAMQKFRADAQLFDGLGHNPHWEAPEVIYRFATQSV